MTRKFVVLTVRCDEVNFQGVFVAEMPSTVLHEDKRTPDEILRSASDKGCEVRFITNYFGISPHYYEQLRRAGVRRVRRDFEVKCEFDIEVDMHSLIYVIE